jgi:hypothetical protein
VVSVFLFQKQVLDLHPLELEEVFGVLVHFVRRLLLLPHFLEGVNVLLVVLQVREGVNEVLYVDHRVPRVAEVCHHGIPLGHEGVHEVVHGVLPRKEAQLLELKDHAS